VSPANDAKRDNVDDDTDRHVPARGIRCAVGRSDNATNDVGQRVPGRGRVAAAGFLFPSPSVSHRVMPATRGTAAAIRQIGEWRLSTKNVMNSGLESLTWAIDVY
jgi:hypothetical protein